MENPLWRVTNVHSLFVDLAMSTKDEKAIKLVHNAKPVTNVLKVFSSLDRFIWFCGFVNVKFFLIFSPMLFLFVRKSKG